MFKNRVLKIVRAIPSGKTLTYKEVAIRAGSPKAYRAVGNIMKGNYNLSVPCHRVIRSDGALGGYNRGGMAAKQKKLEQEKRSHGKLSSGRNIKSATGCEKKKEPHV